ncbi:MAG: NAD-dependent protein deacylase [Desulfovibrionaceae bacterium]
MTFSHKKEHSEAAAQAAALWRSSRHVIALTGAGVSVPSGIPDFRSPGGLWTRFDPMEVATIDALRRSPRRVWEFLLDAAKLFGAARPNPAHEALAALEAAGRLDAIITQNIDSLHQAAGSERVIEFHGSGARYYCQSCREPHDPDLARALTSADLPWRCGCGGVIRPDFVFFGEAIPRAALSESFDLAQRADLCVIVGTSGEVAPANTIPYEVKRHGGKVMEINLGRTEYGPLADVRFDAPCEQVLPALKTLVLS